MKIQETVIGGLVVEQEILLEFGNDEISIGPMVIKQTNWPGKSLIRVQYPLELSAAIQSVHRQIEEQSQKIELEIKNGQKLLI